MSALGCGLLVLGVWGAGMIPILLGLREFGYHDDDEDENL